MGECPIGADNMAKTVWKSTSYEDDGTVLYTGDFRLSISEHLHSRVSAPHMCRQHGKDSVEEYVS